MDPSSQARIVLLTGDGKGKTSSALGMVLRAIGNGLRVSVFFFVKQREDVGEVTALRNLPAVEVRVCGRGFVPPANSPHRAAHRAAAEAGLAEAAQRVKSPEVDLVVLDEICGAVAHGLLERQAVLDVLASARPGLIVILTGRNACPELQDAADTVSRVECVKHGRDDGWPAQRGVEL